MNDNTKRFDGKGKLYDSVRQGYVSELYRHIAWLFGDEKIAVADIGSGTGKLTKELLEMGYTVYGVEPNTDMRNVAEEKLAGYDRFVSVCGTADNTGLSDGSVDFVTAAQAFHWFDAEAFAAECRRILKDDGYVAIIYNLRDMKKPVVASMADIYYRFSPEFHGFSNGMSEEKCRDFFGGNCEVVRFPNDVVYDRERFFERMDSSSYAPKANDPSRDDFRKAVDDLFDRFGSDGRIVFPSYNVAFIGRRDAIE